MLEGNMYIALLLTCAIVSQALQAQQSVGVNFLYPRKSVVNLDLDPQQRWKQIISYNRAEIMSYWYQWVPIADKLECDQDDWAKSIEHSMDPQHKSELEGIWQILFGLDGHMQPQEDVNWKRLLLFQGIYELGSPLSTSESCSEVIAATTDGTVIHARNLDYVVITPIFEIAFQKKGQTIFVSPMFLGKVGFNTGIKLGAWSFGQNTRLGEIPSWTGPRMLNTGGKLFSLFVRELMEENLSFDQVALKLFKQPLLSSMYFIIAGKDPYAGAVITRDPDKARITMLDQKTHLWYLFQTNTDLDEGGECPRAAKGKLLMDSYVTQEGVAPDAIMEVMRTPPILQSSNVFLFMMSPKAGKFCTVLGGQITNDDTSVDRRQCSLNGWNVESWTIGDIIKNATLRWLER